MKFKITFISLLYTAIIVLLTLQVRAQGPLLDDPEVETLCGGFQFVEGPLWIDDLGLIFSDIPASQVYLWTSGTTATSYINPSGNSNGLALDLDGYILLAQHGSRQIARREANGTLTPMATHYLGDRLNSPNDVVVKSDGSVFFTDPPYGVDPNPRDLSYCGIFRISPAGVLQLLDSTIYRPNGITFSPDESLLYVDDAENRDIYIFDVVDDTTIQNKRLFAHQNPMGSTDGMKTDSFGCLYAAGPGGIWIYRPDGSLVRTVSIPGQTTNCNWGDDDRRSLFVTSGNTLYRIRNAGDTIHVDDTNTTTQLHWNVERSHDYSLNLFSYPNPSKGVAQIVFTINEPAEVGLCVFNSAGMLVNTLIDRELMRGTHQVTWDASKMNNGAYYLYLYTPLESVIRKCLLMQ